MLTDLLPVPHRQQSRSGACLPACARMVLEFWGHFTSEADLARRLGTQSFGTPAPNLRRLETLGFSVAYESITLAELHTTLKSGVPRLVFVRTRDLLYWNEDTAHALVAVGIDDETLYVNDPAFDVAPQTIPMDYFLLAWSELDYRSATIRPK